MYAVIETGGKQYRVAPGDTLQVEKLAGEAGAALEFGTVLAVGTDSGELLTGAAAAKVTASIAKQGRGDKELVFKFKRKKQYKKTIGHRQYLTTIKIEEILA